MTVPHVETYTAKLVFEQVGMNEDSYEQSVIEVLRDELGYEHLYGPDVIRTSNRYDDAFLPGAIEHALKSINPSLSRRAIDGAITRLKEIEGGSLVAKNKVFMDMLQNGVEVRWFDGTEDRTDIVKLIDFDEPPTQFIPCRQPVDLHRARHQ